MLDFLVLLFILPFVSAQEIPDYDKPYAPIFFDKPIYSWTDKINIKIIAPSWNADSDLIDSIGDDNQNPIKISTRSNSLEQYRLTETDVRSGIFTGEIILTGFLHDANGDGDFDTNPRTIGNGPTNGFLEVERDSAITVSFEFADGVVLTESVPITWNVGTIQFSKNVSLSDDSVTVRVVDLDMNLNPESLDHVSVEFFSDSDVGGITVNAVEVSEDSGAFIATITLSQTMSSSGSRLYAIPGDEIFAKYDDHTLPKPHSISDDLEIQTSTIITSSIPPTERLGNIPITFSNSLGNPLLSFSSNNPIQVVGTVINQQQYTQNFVYLFQIKNSTNLVESISWIQGELSAKQSLDVSQSWIPKKSGTYKIQTFVWDSLGNSTPLAPQTSTLITIE